MRLFPHEPSRGGAKSYIRYLISDIEKPIPGRSSLVTQKSTPLARTSQTELGKEHTANPLCSVRTREQLLFYFCSPCTLAHMTELIAHDNPTGSHFVISDSTSSQAVESHQIILLNGIAGRPPEKVCDLFDRRIQVPGLSDIASYIVGIKAEKDTLREASIPLQVHRRRQRKET